MKQFRRLHLPLLIALSLVLALPLGAMAANFLNLEGATLRPLITTVDDPANHVVAPGTGYDGVAKIIVSYTSGTYLGSGTLLAQGGKQYLLTAAHVVDIGGPPLSFTAYFPGGQTATAAQYFLAPGWNGDFLNGYDLAIVKLTAPVATQAYNILSTDFFGTLPGTMAGYGRAGLGTTGTTLPAGTLRQGQNTFGEALWFMNGSPYAYDFDNGEYWQNTLYSRFSIPSDYGLGVLEALIAPGDSGGPTFIGGKIAGVHSFGATYGMPWDVDDLLNSSFGELAGDTRVPYFADWINTVVVVPVPGAVYLLASGLGILVFWRRRPQ